MAISPKKNTSPASKKHLSLIELTLIIGVILILVVIGIVAINPSKQLGDARNAQRRTDVNAILNAVHEYRTDNNGTLPETITATSTEICRSGLMVDCIGLINLNVLTGAYLTALPFDPKAATKRSTKYVIVKSGNRVTISAPSAEQEATISVTR